MLCQIQYIHKTKYSNNSERADGTDMNKMHKNTKTFLIKIMGQQNGTWQGSVTWIENQREQYFRSALELLKLIDGTLDTNDTMKNEE